MRFSTPVSCNPSCCQAAVHEDYGWRMLGRNSVGNVRGWTEFLVAMLENCAAVAAFVHVKREPLPSKTASSGCCEHLVASENDKSFYFWQVSFNVAPWCYCCMSCISCVYPVLYMLRQLLGHIFLYLYFREEALSTTGWLNHCRNIVLLPAEYVGQVIWWTNQVGAEDNLCCCHWPRAIDKGIVDFLEQGAIPLGRCGGMF